MRSERYIPYLLVLPSVLFLLFLFAWPLVEALLLSIRGAGGEWTLENFQRMAADLYFKDAIKYTVLLAVVVVPLQVVLALCLALLLGGIGKGRDLFLYVWTIPLGISDLAAGIVWLAIFTERGYLNSFLQALGVIQEPRLWLNYETPAMLFLAVVAAEVWRATAIVFVILVAGLQLIPKEYGEAAEVFGASPWRRFWKVTLPLLTPSLQVALILRTILALEVFAVVVALGGRNLPVLAGEAYYWYNAYQNPGVAAAYSVLILGISVLATLLYLRLMRSREVA
ncbi:binding-protein-dependent transport systems inner membrane component [Allomeiothermus silvanus DSM 9946]|uniref:Binding-protein-dependent transport systems inner membrane component n=1 Tax=Allomeiothermus silvanus (strain ATCC 700542 / DSM 9946 / NBRC 106475 / NCIMB 13440 / VI-R2) TaxID=526227 RepID=D7BAR6_ALLS1|nr:sugar ABC transporter permease [Allomeiothermus silvanus]ADH62588.1 binding-protein-dependent transport systems inner membrane component [Allomeiothermus silvanus DSM 9946]